MQNEYNIQVDYVSIKPNGEIDVNDLVDLLSQEIKTLVSLMHVNNEIGTVLDLNKVGRICKQHNALFHSDTVQSIGKTEIDLVSSLAGLKRDFSGHQEALLEFGNHICYKFMDQDECIIQRGCDSDENLIKNQENNRKIKNLMWISG